MAVAELKVELRDQAGKGAARKLRAQGMIPGVLYGGGEDAAALTVDPLILKKLIMAAPSRSFLVNLKIKGKTHRAMLKDLQIHPVKRGLLHVDFQRVRADQAVTLEVAVELVGTPAGIVEGGILEQSSRYVLLSGLPDKIPPMVELEVSGLEIGDTLKVEDLVLEEGITSETPLETVLAAVVAPTIIEEPVEEEEEGEEGEAAEGEAQAEEAEAKGEPEEG
jgi:large subunit ribosomal protein L25